MASGLDMSLDDMIAKNRKSGSGSSRRRARNSGSGPGPSRRFPNGGANRAAPYTTVKAPETTWKHDMFSDQALDYLPQVGRASGIETGTKLFASNLDYGVSSEDLKELFSEVGDVKRCTVHYDRSGRSKGTAEVVFSRRVDALAAIKRYNDVQLDGKPMKIEIVEKSGGASTAPATNGASKKLNGVQSGSSGATRRRHGGNRGGKSRGKGRDRGEKLSAEDLDADLEKYHAEAMQTN